MRTIIFAFSILSTSYFATLADEPSSTVTAPAAEKAATEKSAPADPTGQIDDERLQAIFAGGIPKSIDELRAMEARQEELAEKVIEFTVGLRVGPAHGSGVIISKDGYILTAAHVAMQTNAPVIITFPDGRRARGRSLGMNRGNDAGMVKIDETLDDDGNVVEWPHAEMGLASDLKRGQWCFAAGHPGGFDPKRNLVVRVGRVLGVSKDVLISDCPLIGGDSGGPLFDMNGNVIGIHSRIGQSLTSNLHVPVNAFADDWDRLANSESWGGNRMRQARPTIGVTVNIDDDFALIREVTAGGPADRAGIQAMDRITHFDGEPVVDSNDLVAAIRERRPGQVVKVRVLRGEMELEMDLRIGKKR